MNILLKTSLILSSVALLGAGCIKHPYETGQTPPRQDFPFVSAISTIDTANWKTYTNTEFGLAFKYPANWPAPKFEAPDAIEFGNQGYIKVTDVAAFTKTFRDCVAASDEATCIKVHGRTPAQLQAHVDLVAGKTTNQTVFDVGCSAIGEKINAHQLMNPNFKNPTTRVIHFCGYDVSVDNYNYYVPFVVNNRLVELNIPLFPTETPVRDWAFTTSGGDQSTNWEVFANNLKVSLNNGQMNEVLAQKMAENDAVAMSIRAL